MHIHEHVYTGKGMYMGYIETLQPFVSFDLGQAKVLRAWLPIKLLHKHLRCRGALLD